MSFKLAPFKKRKKPQTSNQIATTGEMPQIALVPNHEIFCSIYFR